jgi:8-oxo-dGTP diphosphatase
MQVIAEDAAGVRRSAFELDHGVDPTVALGRQGLQVLRPIEATGADQELTLRLLVDDDPVRARKLAANGHGPTVREDEVPADAEPIPQQRVAAYAWVESSRGILASEFSRATSKLRWSLAGGGIDLGEEPREAVHREVMEETAQTIELGDLVGVNSRHWIGRNFAGVVEDFHAVQLIYRAHCPEPTDPVVLDVGGSTSAAAWFPHDGWQDQPWMPGWRILLLRLFG